VISARDLRRDYGSTHALAGASFEVPAGQTVALLGPNGAGKSTLLQILAGVVTPTSGGAKVAGLLVPEQSRGLGRRVGFVPQGESLYPELTVAENLRFFGRLHGVRGRKLRERVATLLRDFALDDRARSRAGDLSGGLRQRAAVATSLVHEPGVLLLDEPGTGLDPGARERLARSLHAYRGAERSVLFSTHDLQEAARVADRVLFLVNGRVVADMAASEAPRLDARYRALGADA
jgi:ABC-2 type transport system ATP-binding protein